MHPNDLCFGRIAARWRRCGGQLLVVGVVLAASGCSGLSRGGLYGEQVAYHVFNATSLPVIHAPRLYAEDAEQTLLYANVQSSRTGSANGRAGSWVRAEQGFLQSAGLTQFQAYDPFGRRLPGSITPLVSFEKMPPGDGSPVLPRPLAGAFRAAARGHRLPDVIKVQWRESAQPGRDKGSGQLHGPFRYRLRAAVPARVLNKLAESWRYQLELAVGASPVDAPTHGARIFWRLGRLSDHGMATVDRGNFMAARLSGAARSDAL